MQKFSYGNGSHGRIQDFYSGRERKIYIPSVKYEIPHGRGPGSIKGRGGSRVSMPSRAVFALFWSILLQNGIHVK